MTSDHQLGRLFVRASDLHRMPQRGPAWVLEGYVARGAASVLAGKVKVGKSTLAKALAVAVASGEGSFLGVPTAAGRVLYATEESQGTFLDGVPPLDDLWIASRERAFPRPPFDHLAAGLARAGEEGAVLAVIDSAPFWWGLQEENDAAAAQRVMEPLLAAAGSGLAIVLVAHQRKSAGEGGDAIRGSSAIAGAADVLIELERAGEDAPPTARRIVAVGRFPLIPPVRVVNFEPRAREWRVLGDVASRADSAALAWRNQLLAVLPESPPRLGYPELEKALRARKRNWRSELDELCEAGLVDREGRGVKGDPYLFLKVTSDSGPPFQPEPRPERPESGQQPDSDSGPPLIGAGIESAASTVSVSAEADGGPETVTSLPGVEWVSTGGSVGHYAWLGKDDWPF
jgi:hypothetical protein